jgi:Fe-S oxidoreductase
MKSDKRVAYFSGCAANYLDPQVGISTIQVLEKNGFQPLLPEQKCCGIPQLVCGDRHSFVQRAEFNVDSLFAAACDIVTTCASCAMALKHEYPKLLGSEKARRVAERAYDILEYLVILKEKKVLNNTFHPVNLRVLYHAPCHLKAFGQNSIERRLQLIRAIPGISIHRIERGCCGMAGTFGSKRSTYPVSMAIGQPLFEGIKESAPDVVATDCHACSLQIHQGTGIAVTHPILLLKKGYGV